MVHRLLFGVSGQTLSFTPATRQAVSWVLEDMTVGEQESTRILASGTIAAPSGGIPTSQDSGPGTPYRDRVFVPMTVAAGEMLRIESADNGVSELFTVAASLSGQHLTAQVPLTTYYPAGSTVDRLRVTTDALADSIVSDRDRLEAREPMRVVWTLADGSRHQEQAWLVRHDHGDIDVPKVIETVRGLFPDIATRMEHHGRDHLEGLVLLQADALKAILRAKGHRPETFLMGDQVRFALAYRVLRHLAALGNYPGNLTLIEWTDFIDGEAATFINDILVGGDGEETQQTEDAEDTALQEREYRRVIRSL